MKTKLFALLAVVCFVLFISQEPAIAADPRFIGPADLFALLLFGLCVLFSWVAGLFRPRTPKRKGGR